MTPFDPILHFLSLELTAFSLRAKLEVCSLNCLRDITRVTKLQNWVT